MVDGNQIQSLLCEIAQPNIKVKIIGHQIARWSLAQQWWSNAQASNSHEIFVLERDYMTCLHSWLLAEHLGYFSHQQWGDRTIHANHYHVMCVRLLLKNHCRFYPVRGHRISWDRLPAHAFDKTQVTIIDQNSLARLDLIENRNWWQAEIDALLDEFEPKLQECRDRLPDWNHTAVNIQKEIDYD
jgi:hypothetical protein